MQGKFSQTSEPAGLNKRLVVWIPTMLAAIAGGSQFLLMAKLISGDILNSYPYISDDGFDWVLQGLALKQLLLGIDYAIWPSLRPPVFVLISALDSSLGAGGYIIVAMISASTAATLGATAFLAKKLNFPSMSIVALMLATLLYNLAYFRMWILSDGICIAFMTWSAVLLLKQCPENGYRRLTISASLAVAAGLTQTYGLIPFLVGSTIIGLSFGFNEQPALMKRHFRAVIVVTVITFLTQAVWGMLVPHASRPENFSLLRLSFDMAGFYMGVWPTAFAVFLPFFIVILRQRKKVGLDTDAIVLLCMVISFLALTFFYQWPDARLTYVYWPIMLFLVMKLACLPTNLSVGQVSHLIRNTCLAIVMLGLLVVPGNGYWQPTVSQSAINWNNTWLPALIQSEPIDRFGIATTCKNDVYWCDELKFGTGFSAYVERTMKEYVRRQSIPR